MTVELTCLVDNITQVSNVKVCIQQPSFPIQNIQVLYCVLLLPALKISFVILRACNNIDSLTLNYTLI